VPSSSAFPDNTEFSAYVERHAEPGSAYGYIRFSFERLDYWDNHVVTKEQVAEALRDLFLDAGYTVTDFTGTMPATLDLPGETDAAN